MYKESIGIIGGFGAYATLGFYHKILKGFATENERNYPHIYLDNNFTMPSRTRALLYGENYYDVVKLIAESINKMCILNVDYIILACGTAHAFLPDVYKLVPEAEGRVLNLLKLLGEELLNVKCKQSLLLAAEGTLKNKVYESYIDKSIKILNPGESCYQDIRFFIEAVKTQNISFDTYTKWIDFVNKFQCENIILGCTELPFLIEKLDVFDNEGYLKNYIYYDPLDLAVNYLKNTLS